MLTGTSAAGGGSGSILLQSGAATGVNPAGHISIVAGAAATGTGGSIFIEPGSTSSGTAGALQIGGGSPFSAIFAGQFTSSGALWADSSALAAGEQRTQRIAAGDLSITNWTPAVGDIVVMQAQFPFSGVPATDDVFTVTAHVAVAGNLDIVVANSQGATNTLSSFSTGTYGILVYRL
jgi:hypothetical protein